MARFFYEVDGEDFENLENAIEYARDIDRPEVIVYEVDNNGQVTRHSTVLVWGFYEFFSLYCSRYIQFN